MSNIKTELRLEQEGMADQVRVEVKNGMVDLEYYNAGGRDKLSTPIDLIFN